MPIVVRHAAKVVLPDDERTKAMILGMFSYTSRSGETFSNYVYKDGVAFLPPSIPKLKVVGAILGKEVIDERSVGSPISSPFKLTGKFKFRDYQVEPADKLLRYLRVNNYGTLSAGCASGKTVVMSYVAGQLGKKVLILIDQSNLAANWITAFSLIYGKEVQVIKGKDTNFSDVCLTTFQLLHRNPELLARMRTTFGCLLVDEAHVVKAATFKEVIMRLDNKYRIGCSATFFVKNLSVEVLEDLLAPICVTMVDAGALIPTVKWVKTGVSWPSEEPMEFASITLPTLAMHGTRNYVILGILKECLANNRRTIVVCIQEVQAEFLCMVALKIGARAVTYVGSTSAKKDKEVYTAFEGGELDFVFVCKKMNKGTDYPSADTIVIAAPNNNETFVRQVSGRVVRKLEGKPEPIVYELLDEGYLAGIFAANRNKWYKQLKYKIEQ